MLLSLLARFLALPWVTTCLLWLAQRHPDSSIYGPDGTLYMERWWLFNPYSRGGDKDHACRWPWVPFSIRMHRIHRPDSDRALHDHPWAFRTFILQNGYVEERVNDKAVWIWGETTVKRLGEFHRIERLVGGPALTLVVMGRKQDDWGFLVDGRRVPWREHINVGTLR